MQDFSMKMYTICTLTEKNLLLTKKYEEFTNFKLSLPVESLAQQESLGQTLKQEP